MKQVLLYLIPFLIITIINLIPLVISYYRKAKYKKIILRAFCFNEFLTGSFVYMFVISFMDCVVVCKPMEKICDCPKHIFQPYLIPLIITIIIIFLTTLILAFIKRKK